VQKVREIIDERIKNEDFTDKIVTVRVEGYLKSGKSFEVKANEIVRKIRRKGAYEVLVNKSHLYSQEYDSVRVDTSESTEEIEKRLVHEHAQKSNLKGISKEKMEEKIYALLEEIGREENPGEKKKNYRRKVLQAFYDIMEIPKEEDEF
jgi:endonuclease IV